MMFRKPEDLQCPDGRREIPRWVFRVKAEFHRMALGADILLAYWEFLASRHA